MTKRIIYQIDSFTTERFTGNPAGVVINADGLTEQQMKQIARELNNSETAFLFEPDDEICQGVIRYFTPQTEVPICGHATIAAMYAKAVEENLDSCILNLKTKIGILPFEIKKEKNGYQVTMTQGAFELNPELPKSTADRILEALGLETLDLDERCPIQIASTGHSKVMIGIRNKAKLNSLSPNNDQLTRISKEIECNGYFVFTFDTMDEHLLTTGRMFAPAIGIKEDPVTGNANGPLGGYLIRNGIVKPANKVFEFLASQGEQMGRPGSINVRVEILKGQPTKIQISGTAAMVFRTEMNL